MELCAQIGCEPYIKGNLGSGTVQEMSEWVEYMTFGGVSPMAELREKNGRTEPWRIKYFGVGNENWGCGGKMRPEHYADEYRRYQAFIRNFGDNRIFRIACGPSGEMYDWTEKLMLVAGDFMDALALHYYTVPSGDWGDLKSATDFSVEEYYWTLHVALNIERVISRHLHIMDRYDPKHRVGLIVDEWGNVHAAEPGTNPAFLYQQNTMRDALTAAATLNIFNAHSDRVVMANIAQIINVLQAVILTEGARMILTPTYHVFDLFKNHHDATLLGHWLEAGEIISNGVSIPGLSASASEKNGKITITIANFSAGQEKWIELSLYGAKVSAVYGRILAGDVTSKNDFDTPQAVSIKPMSGIETTGEGLGFTLPACAVAEVVIE